MLSINISELVLTIISFFLLMFLLNKFLFKPVTKFMNERQARMDAELEKERAAQAELEESEKQIEQSKDASREEAKNILAAQRKENGRLHDECVKQLTAESTKDRRDARAQVEAQAKDARAKLDQDKDELAQTLAGRLMNK